jgi:hypothetical protein
MKDRMPPIKIGKKPFRATIYQQINRIRWLTYCIVWYKPVVIVRGPLVWLKRRIKKTKTLSDKREAIRFAEGIYSRLTALSQNGKV